MLKKDDKGIPLITIFNREKWRNWLEKNHLKERKVGIILHKKHTGKPSISHREAMHEAINFGWIDTTIKRLDEAKFIRYFVRRGDKANWSKNTLSYGKQLLKAGRMSPHGILRFKQGLKKKPHDQGLARKPRIPEELKNSLMGEAKKNFEHFPQSIKITFYRWILRAKRKDTRDKRINLVVNKALNNDKTLQ